MEIISDKKNTKFISQQKDILSRLKSIDYSNKETTQVLSYLSKKINKPLSNVESDSSQPSFSSLEKISSTYSNSNIKKLLDSGLNSDLKNLSSFLDVPIKLISQIVHNQKQIEVDYSSILKEINSKENDLNEVIENYSTYLVKNKTLLTRNEILQTFVSKINITKEEKDDLVNQNSFNESFFKLIFKMTQIKNDIQVIERNSETFSKNLLFSIKENYNIVDDLLNEKIVIFLKNLFRNKKTFTWEEFSHIILTLSYLNEKENYLNFILKEYVQMRKKNLEENLRNKYLKINKLDEIFKILIEDFEFYFLKEFITLFALFNNSSEILNREDEENILILLNYYSEGDAKELSSVIEGLISKLKNCKKLNAKDFNFYVTYLNPILYILEELFYEHVNYHKSLENIENNLADMYKITILAYFYHSKIENILKSNNFSLNNINENLNLFSMISNYKKSFSKILSKISNDTYKNLQKIQKNILNILREENLMTGNNESTLNKNFIHTVDEYAKCFSYFSQFGYTLNNEDKENLCPKSHNSFKLLIEIFNTEGLNNETNILILLKVLNLIQITVSKLSKYSNLIEEEINTLNKIFQNFEISVVKNLTDNILKSTKFEDNLKKNISQEQTISLIEHIMEKSQFYFLNLNLIYDFDCRENLKAKVKREILTVYKEILLREENLNLSFFSEEEFKNYLDIL